MIRPRTIQNKLLGIFLVAAVLPLAAVSGLAYRNSLKAVEEMVGNRTARLAGSVGEELSRKLKRRLDDRILIVNQPVQDFLASVDDGKGPADQYAARLALSGYVNTLFEEYGRYYRDMILADAAGDPIFRVGPSKGGQGTVPSSDGGTAAVPETPGEAVPTLSDSLAALFPYEIPLPGELAERAEGFRQTFQAETQRALVRAESLDALRNGVPRPPEAPSVLPPGMVESLTRAFSRTPVPPDETPAIAGYPRDVNSRLRLLESLFERQFTEEDRQATRTAVRLDRDQNLVIFHRGTAGEAEAVRVARPIYSTADPSRRLGAAILDLRLDYLFPEDLATQRFGSKGDLAVINVADGEILFHTRREMVGQNLRVTNPVLAAALEKHDNGRSGNASWFELKDQDGHRLAGFFPVESVGWAVVSTAVPREFESEARNAGLINLVVAAAAVILALGVLLVSSRKISRSIHTVTEGAREIAAGNLGHSIRVTTHDEIETLADTFNGMTASLRESISLREKAAQELEALNRTLEDRVRERTQRLTAVNEALNRANQELKELDRLKSNFLATVSHEFKTPLTSITAFSEILVDEMKEKDVPFEVHRFLHIIHTESERLGRLIRNLLDLSRIEAGRMRWERSRFAIRDVLGASLDGLLPVFAEKSIRVERDISCPEAMVAADRDRIQQVITNLLENAVKFSEKGKRIWIECRPRDGEENGHRALEITVRDEGPGIPAAHLGRIFERFWQVDSTETRRTGGSGLGLAISKEIVEHHGGRIWAESDPGRGAAFHFTLPCTEGREREGSGGAPAPGASAREGGSV